MIWKKVEIKSSVQWHADMSSGEEILAQITAQGLAVREIKSSGADKDAITVEVRQPWWQASAPLIL